MSTPFKLKKQLLLLLFISCQSLAFCQILTLGQYPQTVPAGKKWVLNLNMTPLIELNPNAFTSGSLLNAQLQSNPRLIGLIAEGEYTRPNRLYQISFRGLTKVPYTNQLTYKISGIVTFQGTDFPQVRFADQREIIFYPGQTVSVNGGIQSIQIMQSSFTATELAQLKKVQHQAAENEKKQIASETAQRKSEAIANYKSVNEAIVNGVEPLKRYDDGSGVEYEDFGLPTTLTYNVDDIKYNINGHAFLSMLDSIKVTERFFIQFDKVGKFKSLFDENHSQISMDNKSNEKFKSAISLVSPIILTYNGEKKPVEFETKEFVFKKSEGYTYRQFAVVPTKTTVEFLDKASINNSLVADVESKFGKTIEIASLSNTEENITHLKTILSQKILSDKSSADRDFTYRNMVLGARASFYQYHFQIKKNVLVFEIPTTQYLINARTKSIAIGLYRDSKDKLEVVASDIKNIFGTQDEVFNIFFYNRYNSKVEELHF